MSSIKLQPGAGAARPVNPYSLKVKPACPTVMIPYNGELFGLPVSRLNFTCEFNVSTAFIKMEGTWTNVANFKDTCMFVLPTTGTVTNVSIEVQGRVYDTAIIPADLADKLKPEETKGGVTGDDDTQPLVPGFNASSSTAGFFKEYIPNFFRLPVEDVGVYDVIKITCVYIETLPFFNGMYHCTLPLTFGSNLLAAGLTMEEVVDVKCIINSVTLETPYECKTHRVTALGDSFPRIELIASGFSFPPPLAPHPPSTHPPSTHPLSTHPPPHVHQEYKSVDFTLSYSQSAAEVLCTLITEETLEENSFVLFITPPSIHTTTSVHARNIVFLIDRSGSMGGTPFIEASRALTAALTNLNPYDAFTIIAFDHQQRYFNAGLLPVSSENIQMASQWISTIPPETGTTDIMTPLDYAITLLENTATQALPLVILLTDGCVPDERDICRHTQRIAVRSRILTFGIGSYCNWFFLKMLAQIGRGFCDVVTYTEKIYTQMLQLLNMAAVPVLTNVKLDCPDVKSLEIFPSPLPDLFMGAPLTISGKYEGTFPKEVTITATDPLGTLIVLSIPARTSEVIPVNKVLIKQRLDLLTAKQWLEESEAMKKEIVDISCEYEIPSAFTSMVSYKRPDQKLDGDDRGIDPSHVHFKSKKGGKGYKWFHDPTMLASLTLGGAVLVGAALFSFGDLAASAGNLPVGDAVGGLGELGGGECCGAECVGCDGCDGGCDDCNGGCDGGCDEGCDWCDPSCLCM